MPSIYIIRNDDKNTEIPINDKLITDTIDVCKIRKPSVAKAWIDVLEELEGKDFEEIYIKK